MSTGIPQQDVSLLPGRYYHPDAKLEVSVYSDFIKNVGHRLYGKKHGIWLSYKKGDVLWEKFFYFEGVSCGIWERYWSNGNVSARKTFFSDMDSSVWEDYRINGELENLNLLVRGDFVPLHMCFLAAAGFDLPLSSL